jgi:preprotein translocase subunit SecA
VSAGARLAIPGPVFGERPRRAEPDAAGDAPTAAPRRGPPANAAAGFFARRRGEDAATVARRAERRAEALARVDDPKALRAAVGEAAAALAAGGLAPGAVARALGVAGAALARRTGLVPRDTQYRCAALLLAQRLVELDTGEGKSVAVALAAGVAALAGAPVHVLTANDYLAARDAEAFAAYYRTLGLRVAAAAESMDDDARRAAWGADVAYATARAVGFDELRDGLEATGGGSPRLGRGLCVAIVDEADAILLDEARTPLIIAQERPDPQARARGWRALDLARRLDPDVHAHVDVGAATATLTPAGRKRVAALIADDAAAAGDAPVASGASARPAADPAAADRSADRSDERDAAARTALDLRLLSELVEQTMAALHAMRRDVHYVVVDREVVLVDATTGRPAPERRLSRAMHLLVALKERLPPPPGTEVLASVTYPRLLARYHHLCGTSGTLRESAAELRATYGLAVVRVGRATPSAMRRMPTRLFVDRNAQFDAAVARAARLARRGRCVLVATDSVADSGALAERFAAHGVAVERLDARHDDDEARRIARAGESGRITVATQMAGRGTDVRPAPDALRAGGLHVLALQHNRSARIDRQVAGRAARQGDPGSVERWLRANDSPLEPSRLPPPLALAAVAVACLGERPRGGSLGRPRAARLRGALVDTLWRACQRWWAHEDRVARADALGHDRRWSRRLHFATMSDIEKQA